MAARKKYFVFLFIIASSFFVKIKGDGELSSQTVLDHWEEQDAEFILGPQKDVILTLGLTGNGKTTTTLFLTGANLKAVIKRNETYIIDDDDKIGNKTIQLKTTFPNLMIDPEEDVAFYDCPGFIDSSKPQYEITNAYFLNKLLSYADKLKIVFVIDHSAFNQASERDPVIQLFKQTFKMIPNIEKLKDGVGMIVTNVRTRESTDENIIIYEIASKLNEIRKVLQEENDPKKLKFNTEMMNILLTQDEIEVYNRIGIFPAPGKRGDLNAMDIYKEAKAKLKKLIHTNLQYVPNTNIGFRFALSTESQNHTIKKLIDHLMEKNLVSNFIEICKEIKQHYWYGEEYVEDISIMKESLQEGVQKLSKINFNQTAPKMLKEIIVKANKLGVGISSEILEQISKDIDYINFLLKVSNQDWQTSTAVTEKVKDTVDKLTNSYKWYRFLMHLLSELSRNKFQNTDFKNIALKFCDESFEQESLKISELGLNDIFKNVKRNDDTALLKKENWTINKYELQALKDLFVDIYDNNIIAVCSEDNKILNVKGYNFKISDVIKEAKQCWHSATVIDIIALHTLIFDESIKKVGQKARITIIAHTWDILDDFEVNLNGKPGESHTSTAAMGEDGKPGNPGGSGGVFVGYYFYKSDSEKFFANGGDGGKGQDGGPGNQML